MIKHSVGDPRWLDKSRALYRRRCKRDPSLPPLLSIAGKVEAKDAVRVILPTAAGIAIVVAAPVGGWRFELKTYDGLPAAALADAKAAVAQPAAATVDQAKSDTDALLDLFVDLERRVIASDLASNAAIKDKLIEAFLELGALRAKHHPHSNVVHFSSIAAE